MVRSPGFGSINSDKCLLSDLLSLWLQSIVFNQATAYKSLTHSSTGTRSHKLPLIVSLGFQVLVSRPRVRHFSSFPHGTSSLSVIQLYLALQGGPCMFTQNYTCFMLLVSLRAKVFRAKKSRCSTTGLSPSLVQVSAASS